MAAGVSEDEIMNTQPLHPGPCPIANAVAAAVLERSRVGHKKYGVTLARLDLDVRQWLQHLQEELLDAAGYVERLKAEVGEKPRACRTCAFAKKLEPDPRYVAGSADDAFECRLMPPANGGGSPFYWPLMKADDFCGRWEMRIKAGEAGK
jgi:hypothetical protein